MLKMISYFAKKTFLVTNDGLINFKVKGTCDVDKDFKEVVNSYTWYLLISGLVFCFKTHFHLVNSGLIHES
jgi:hypothetical protein